MKGRSTETIDKVSEYSFRGDKMKNIIVTGSSGLIGSEVATFFHDQDTLFTV
jgi:hypothetical protein